MVASLEKAASSCVGSSRKSPDELDGVSTSTIVRGVVAWFVQKGKRLHSTIENDVEEIEKHLLTFLEHFSNAPK